MYGVGRHNHSRFNSSLSFITSCQNCTGQPGYPRQARLPRITGIFHRKHSKMGSVDPNEWVQCDNCGWWMPTESNDYVVYDFAGPYGASLHRSCKWCESGKTSDRRTREHFADCCGVQGFGPDKWFNSHTECTKWRSVGENVPDRHHLIFFVISALSICCAISALKKN